MLFLHRWHIFQLVGFSWCGLHKACAFHAAFSAWRPDKWAGRSFPVHCNSAMSCLAVWIAWTLWWHRTTSSRSTSHLSICLCDSIHSASYFTHQIHLNAFNFQHQHQLQLIQMRQSYWYTVSSQSSWKMCFFLLIYCKKRKIQKRLSTWGLEL